jgi:hypothetical protein
MELKWILAIAAEASFWTLFVAFLLLRYRYGRDRASIGVLVAIVVDHVVLLGLAVWDYAETGAVSGYTVVVLGILVYALTLGRRDMRRVDAWGKERFTPRDRRPPGARSVQPHRP